MTIRSLCRTALGLGTEVRLRATIKIFSLSIVFITAVTESAFANPYLAKVGERSTSIRIATCAVSGGFVHLYAAIENNLFEKYGFKLEHIYIRGTGPSLAALMADEIQFLYCAADATIPSLATGVDASLWRRPWSKCLSYWLHKKRFEN